MKTYDRRIQSAELTSTGIGHKFVHPPPFHKSSSRLKGPPPLSLDYRPCIPVASIFTSTSQMDHSRKPLTGPLADVKYPLAPPHWKTHTMTDLNRRIKDCWALRVLPSPTSETRDHYRGQPARISPSTAPSYELLALYGKLAADQTVPPPGPVLSTTHRDYRHFNSFELNSSYSGQAKPLPEGLTKSSAYSHMPGHKAPSTTSCYPRLSRRSVAVPYGAYTSLYRDSFTTPALPRTLSHQVQPQHPST
ncbi:hypothetical protein AALO_G00083230 [Alosa alosa]|uniref:Uncharacterized protein n=2 Tax=Alosa alosa TaxID=278164 RepID=A0AAV6H3J3_9TELE|nr:uncharacterized protein zgc:193811 isoform X1 [Alosa alosa]KAG5279941.1 hypothetical protein AALO_G00083230 [Alosa alosa]